LMYVGRDFAFCVRVVRCRWSFINLKLGSARAFHLIFLIRNATVLLQHTNGKGYMSMNLVLALYLLIYPTERVISYKAKHDNVTQYLTALPLS
jgi:hypothetical protein